MSSETWEAGKEHREKKQCLQLPGAALGRPTFTILLAHCVASSRTFRVVPESGNFRPRMLVTLGVGGQEVRPQRKGLLRACTDPGHRMALERRAGYGIETGLSERAMSCQG